MSTIKSSDEHLTLNADGSGKDIKFQANGVEKASIDSSGNVGIGVTPKTWDSRKALQIGGNGTLAGSASAGAGGYLQLLQNAYTDGTWKYISTDEAARLRSQDGQWNFDVAASGSANSAITWATKVTIDTDGLKFGTDTASANALHDYEEGTCTMNFKASGSSTLAGSSSATYTKIGKMVTVQGEISGTISSLTQNDSMNLQGLPFTPNGTGSCPIFTRYLETPTDTTNVVGYYNSGAASIEVWFMPNHANYVRAKVQDFHNSNNDIYFTVTYLTNS